MVRNYPLIFTRWQGGGLPLNSHAIRNRMPGETIPGPENLDNLKFPSTKNYHFHAFSDNSLPKVI